MTETATDVPKIQNLRTYRLTDLYNRILRKSGAFVYIPGHLDLRGTDIEVLPMLLHTRGDLHVENCSHLREFPKGAEIGGDAYLQGSGITIIFPGSKIAGKVEGLEENRAAAALKAAATDPVPSA